jgi:hypothetical protein
MLFIRPEQMNDLPFNLKGGRSPIANGGAADSNNALAATARNTRTSPNTPTSRIC